MIESCSCLSTSPPSIRPRPFILSPHHGPFLHIQCQLFSYVLPDTNNILNIFLVPSFHTLRIFFERLIILLWNSQFILIMYLFSSYSFVIPLSPSSLSPSPPPSSHPVPSTHAPPRNPVCSLRRSLTVYYLGLASRSFLTS